MTNLYIHNIMPKHGSNALQKKICNQFKKGNFSVKCSPSMGHTRYGHGVHLTGQKSWIACIGVRGGGSGRAAAPRHENFLGKLCFQGKHKLLKNPE